ncbi:hypothetical protein K493DRAFT_335623 [Basidiobolus meristosporus CBS 931.73]|uniref:Sec7-domain-containing protein n=1 Tax=Basidiobolus meristosporus CBS 931.73 TaxID=1314790 RepID=A0A1Y1YQ66_9FUNG|nr:hypothetical protein K493DRAFT_335623 [Basidiobolus meristosporus CBS 931.73]|eukprot:ORX99714.1 hypothetical protein K493DRAFT_335623 [Basidiobolus meristosporus CBS 931.73]
MTAIHQERPYDAGLSIDRCSHAERDSINLTGKTAAFTSYHPSQSQACKQCSTGCTILVVDKQSQYAGIPENTPVSASPTGDRPKHSLSKKDTKLTISVANEPARAECGNHVSTKTEAPLVLASAPLNGSTSTLDSSKGIFGEPIASASQALVRHGSTGGLQVAKYTKKDEPLWQHMAEIDFVGQAIDMALRRFLASYQLPKEAQQIDRVMVAFAKRYHQCNSDLFPSPDVVYSIAFSLMLLHTDAHNKHVKHKMSKTQYIRQTRTLEQGNVIAPEILSIFYDNITSAQFIYANGPKKAPKASWIKKVYQGTPPNPYKLMQAMSTQFAAAVLASKISLFEPGRGQYSYRGSQSVVREAFLRTAFKLKVSGVKTYFQDTIGGRHMSAIAGPQEPEDFSILKCAKEGLVSRKCDLMDGGKRATRRSWKELWMVLSGSQLIFFQDVAWFKNQNHRLSKASPKPHSILSTENCICLIDKDYNTYPNVFRLVTPTCREYLFRYHSESEMLDWMANINYAATFKTVALKPRGVDEITRLSKSLKCGASLAPGVPAAVTEADRVRSSLVQRKIRDLSERIIQCQRMIEADGRLQKQMSIMVPLQRHTRQKAIDTASEVSKRLKESCLQLEKWECYKEILEADLVIAKLEEARKQRLTTYMEDQPEIAMEETSTLVHKPNPIPGIIELV